MVLFDSGISLTTFWFSVTRAERRRRLMAERPPPFTWVR